MSTPPVESWRGVAAERRDDVSTGVGALLRRRTRTLLSSLLRPHRRALWGLVVLIVLQNLAALAGPYLIGLGIDRGIPPILHGEGPRTLWLVVAAFAVATVVQTLAMRAFLILTGRIGQDFVLELRRRVFAHFQRLSTAFHEDYTSGRVISRQTSDMDAISELVEEGIDELVIAVLSVLTIGAAMLLLDVPLALVALSSFPLLLWLSAWFRKHSAVAYRRTREAVALVIVHFVETLAGIRAVQAFRREPRNFAIFDDLNTRYRDATRRSFQLISVYAPGMKLIGNATIGIVLLYGGFRALDGDIRVGVLTTFLLYLRRFFDPLQDLSQFYNAFQSASAALEKLAGVLEEPPSVPEPALPHPLGSSIRGEMSFSGVTFGYRDRVVLPHLDLVIPAGQTVALVGPTGAGKTTIARLVGRFYDADAGTVCLDGVDLRDLDDETLHRAIVTVTQESFLFSGSVADNIAFGRPGVDRARIEQAAAAIGAHEHDLLLYATQRLQEIDGLRIVGTAAVKASVISFTLEGVHPHDIGTILDQKGIAIRTGHHCAQPLMLRFKVPATGRASFGMYNTREEADQLVAGLHEVIEVFR